MLSKSLHKRTRLLGYKYTMKPSEQRFTIFIFYCIYNFRVSLSRILLYFFLLKNNFLSIGLHHESMFIAKKKKNLIQQSKLYLLSRIVHVPA